MTERMAESSPIKHENLDSAKSELNRGKTSLDAGRDGSLNGGQARSPRVARKRQETRHRILEHAEALMRSRPVDEVTIQDITEAADVGHGTFYLHFKSKYEVLIPIIRAQAEQWDQVIQANMKEYTDPAEVVGFSTRIMGRVINDDSLWRWMLQHSGMPVEDLRDSVGRFAARDFGRGLLSGRFTLPDLANGSSFMLGAFVNGLLASFESENPEQSIDQMAELLLRVLGLSVEEAQAIAHQPIPPMVHRVVLN